MICSSCVYLMRQDAWLMLLRNKKAQDVNQGKWIGVGGKKEADETMEECAAREVKEETGLEVQKLCFNGTVHFIYPHAEEMIYIYSSTLFHGEMQACDEGELKWIDKKDLLKLNLWEGDRIFMRKMLEDEKSVFRYTFVYNAENQLTEVKEGTV